MDDRFDNETAYQRYCAIRIAEGRADRPDVRHIEEQGGRCDVGETIVAGVRMRVFFWT